MRGGEAPAGDDLRPLRSADLSSHGAEHGWDRVANVEGMGSRRGAGAGGNTCGSGDLMRRLPSGQRATDAGEDRGRREEIRAIEDARPWEMVGSGRYMPRRIRGSLRGRELG